MNVTEIDIAVEKRQKLRFCENGQKGMIAVECIPVAREYIGGNLVVGVFIAEGVRVATVDSSLLSRTVDGAARAIARKHQVLSSLASAGWRYAATKTENISNQGAATMPPGSGTDDSGIVN